MQIGNYKIRKVVTGGYYPEVIRYKDIIWGYQPRKILKETTYRITKNGKLIDSFLLISRARKRVKQLIKEEEEAENATRKRQTQRR
ncbi:hypothetical protein LCGC14_1690410 [marine sediment metagenome]|uniref:Uncharacterized protein n=1 Tax=marine sediment metagenome TaxID=412755 RepID=A0A0F9HKW0_9ZZZZ